MKQTYHNPQNLSPEQFGGPDGFRLLTQEEAAVLTDPAGRETFVARQLRELLTPELYNEAACLWQPVYKDRTLDESFTYRTSSALIEQPPAKQPFGELPGDIEDAANMLVELCHGEAVLNGWHTNLATGEPLPVNVPEKLLLIHSEVSEACEGFRKNLADDKLPNRPMVEVELADAAIRIFDLAGAMGLDLGGAILEKMEFNRKRADHKPEARRGETGKKF